VLCDEPTGNLDSATSEEILKLLRSLPEPGKRSVVMVTHDAHAATFGDRIVYLRDGRVESEEWITENTATLSPFSPASQRRAGRCVKSAASAKRGQTNRAHHAVTVSHA